jgi:acyl carrier protein
MTMTVVSGTSIIYSTESIADWLHAYIADLRNVRPERISRRESLHKYGLDSASAVTLTGDLTEWLKMDVDPSVLYEHPTIDGLASHLAKLKSGG